MRCFVLFIVLVLPSTVFSQLNKIDGNGLRQGIWEKSYSNGKIMYKGEFRDGKPVGEWLRYHPAGSLKARIQYEEDSDSAFVQLFDKRGIKIAEGAYINEQREGTWIFFSGNRMLSKEEYKNGKRDGTSWKFYESGDVFEESEWQKGIKEGNYRVFFENGKPYMECKYSNDKRNGLCLVYYRNGRIEMEAWYKDNLRHGDWKFYSEEGPLLYTLEYENGRLLNPDVRDSIDNLHIKQLEKNRNSIPDPEKFIQDPTEYMIKMQEIR